MDLAIYSIIKKYDKGAQVEWSGYTRKEIDDFAQAFREECHPGTITIYRYDNSTENHEEISFERT